MIFFLSSENVSKYGPIAGHMVSGSALGEGVSLFDCTEGKTQVWRRRDSLRTSWSASGQPREALPRGGRLGQCLDGRGSGSGFWKSTHVKTICSSGGTGESPRVITRSLAGFPVWWWVGEGAASPTAHEQATSLPWSPRLHPLVEAITTTGLGAGGTPCPAFPVL